MTWEIDWGHEGNTGTHVWARNPISHIRRCREWHWTATGELRKRGVKTPVYRADSWEVDWSRRKDKLVWACNPQSVIAHSREWHWVDFHTLQRAGLQWKPKRSDTGRYIGGDGYVYLTSGAMTQEDIRIATECGIWLGGKACVQGSIRSGGRVAEHRLVAAKKYGPLPKGTVIRHLNGHKVDNRPSNLIYGSDLENKFDHETARRMAMYWHNRYEVAEREITKLREELSMLHTEAS